MVLGTKSAKGVGGMAATINRQLADLGFDPNEVYAKFRNAKGARFWKAKGQIDAALEKVRAALAD